jgi:soluble lytic murein transglycosylase
MEATAADIARKLKMQDYNLEDPDTNILFGAFYLEEMLRRIEDAPVLGFFAYNGGISRVRSWKKSAALEFSPRKISNDLFLEALPYAETREYGRKLTAASAIYGWLYQNEAPLEIVTNLLGLSK